MDDQHGKSHRSDELTLADMVFAVRDFIFQAIRNWWLFVGLFLLFGGYFVYTAYQTPVTYKATFTFMRDDDESAMSSMASILGQFGFGASRGRFNLDRVLELAKSRRIVQKTIFDQVKLNERTDFLGNHIIDIYELDQDWVEKNPELEGFRFASSTVDSFSTDELQALRKVYSFIVGNEDRKGLLSATYSEESTILSFSAQTEDADLSIKLITELYHNLSDYYIAQSTEKQKATYDIVKAKADSIGALLRSAEAEYARFRDANRNLFSYQDQLREQQLSREIQKLTVIHTEALRNVEIADFSLRTATPVIMELDKPIPPLEPIIESKVKAAALGFVAAVLLGSIILLIGNFRRRLST